MNNGLKHRKLSRVFAISLSVLGTVLLVSALLIAALPTLLSTSWGQQKLMGWLVQATDTKIQVKQLRLSWLQNQEIQGLEIQKKKDLSFSCDLVKTQASLWQILLDHDVKDLFLDHPSLHMQLPHLSKMQGLFSEPLSTPQVVKIQPAGFLPLATWLFKKEEAIASEASVFSIPFSGVVHCSFGKAELLSEGLDPILFDEVSFLVELSEIQWKAGLHLECKTLQNQIEGKILADTHFSELNTPYPSLSLNTRISRLPMKGVDQLLSSIQPTYQKWLQEIVGDTIDIVLNAQSSKGVLDIDFSAASPQLMAQLATTKENGKVFLKSPAECSLTLHPASFDRLTKQFPALAVLSLKEAGTLYTKLYQFSCPLPHSEKDFEEASLSAEVSTLSPFTFDYKGSSFVLKDLHVQANSQTLSQGIQLNGQTVFIAHQKPAQCAGKMLFNPFTQTAQFSLETQDIPMDLFGELSGQGNTLATALGSTAAFKLSGTLSSERSELHIGAQSPLLQVEDAHVRIQESIELLSPLHFSYVFTPSLLDLLIPGYKEGLAGPAAFEGSIDTLSFFPSQWHALQLKMNLLAHEIHFKESWALSLQEMQVALSVDTLDRISLHVTSSQAQAAIQASYQQKARQLQLTTPFSFNLLVDNGLLHTLLPQAACLIEPVSCAFLLQPFNLPVDSFSLSSVQFQGLLSAPLARFAHPDGKESVALQDVNVPFQWDGRKKMASIALNMALSQASLPAGSFALQTSWSNVQIDHLEDLSLHAALNMQHIPTSLLDALVGRPLFIPLVGEELNATANFDSQPSRQQLELNLNSALIKMQATCTAKDGKLFLQGSPAQINWILTPQSYKAIDALLIGSNRYTTPFELKDPSTFQLTLTQLSLPLLPPSTSTHPLQQRIPCVQVDLLSLACAGSASNSNALFFDNSSHEWIQLSSLLCSFQKLEGHSPLSFSLDSQVSTQGQAKDASHPKKGSLSARATLDGLWNQAGKWEPSSLSSKFSINASQIPSRIFDLIARMKQRTDFPFTKIFGAFLNASLQADLNHFTGPLSLHLDSPLSRFALDASVQKGILLLEKPLYAQWKITPEMSRLLLREVNPLSLSYFYSENPITVEIPKEGFYLPFDPINLAKMAIPAARIELGKVACRNEGNVNMALSLLKSKQFEGQKELTLWFAPIDFRIKQGVLDLERTEILIENTFDVAIWGQFLLLKDYVDMVLGLTANTLHKAFGIRDLPEDYVLTIPMQGKSDDVQINSAKATTKIALLLATQQKIIADSLGKTPAGALFGGLMNKLATLPDSHVKVPPAKHPFPWEVGKKTYKKQTSESAEGKKRRFKQNEKPVKQLLKVIH